MYLMIFKYSRTVMHLARFIGAAILSFALWSLMQTNVWMAGDMLWYWLLDTANLGFHEAGHFLFMSLSFVFGYTDWVRFLHVAGGSLTEWSVPLVLSSYFLYKKQWFSATFLLFWFGQTLHGSVLYIGDAIVMELPLLGGNDSGGHDWNYLLHELGVLYNAKVIATTFEKISYIVMTISVIGCWVIFFFYLLRDLGYPKALKRV